MRRLKVDGRVNWHVTLRGARRLLMFQDDQDFEVFLVMLRKAYRASGVTGTSHSLMSNHAHLGMEGANRELTACMRKLDRGYSGYFNQRYKLSGHAFEQEYYSGLVASDFILQRVTRYIHLNPVRAGLVKRPEEYPWSNAAEYFSGDPDFLDSNQQLVLRTFGSDLRAAREAYRRFVEQDIDRPVLAAPGKSPAFEMWQEQFQWILQDTRSRAEALLPWSPEVAAVLRAVRAGVPPRAIGKVLGDPDGKRASRIAYRLSMRLKAEPELATKFQALEAV